MGKRVGLGFVIQKYKRKNYLLMHSIFDPNEKIEKKELDSEILEKSNITHSTTSR